MGRWKKGFTLIELLAVIVILGIIALISIPMINDVIKESRLGAFKASTLSLFHAYTNYEAEHGFEIKDEINIFDLDITNKSTFLSGEIYRKEDSIKVENVSNGRYCASGTQENLKIVEGTCDLLDETPPKILSVTTEVTTNSIKLYTSYLEEESFISKHEYRIVRENEDIENATWVSGDSLTENLSTKTFSGLEQGVKYKIQVRLTNTALENNVSEIYELEVSTLTLEKPVITLLTSKEYAS